jgi:hypothetical protein
VYITKLAGAIAAGVITFGISAAAPASATDNIKPFGEQERLIDGSTGGPMIGYTVTGLTPSSDPVPHNGDLYEATVTVEGFGGWATPLIPMFNARAQSGVGYPVIVNAPGGLSGAAVAPGDTSTGKLYFDVVGDVPNSVVYNDGTRDILAWVPGAPQGGTRP